MVLIANFFGTYVSMKNLGLSPRKLPFSPMNNHVPREKELKLPWGATNFIFSLKNNLSIFFQSNLSPILP
jgi:hypothetical protein